MATCFVLLVMLLAVLVISDFITVKAKLCEKPSKTWFGNCKDAEKCDKQCKEWEDALHGSCHQREAKYMCFCYSECSPKDKKPTPPGGGKSSPPTPPGKPTPSPEGGQPPPSDGGQQPTPPSDGGNPAPSPGAGQQPAPPPESQPAPPSGCSKMVTDRLIAEALANYKT